jgi:outer membrane biosynthesis protein TonB
MLRSGRTLSVVVGYAILAQGSATASPTAAPHPGTDFPSSESFYPYSARLWAQEGATVVHYCVDANGRLSGEPTVERTSGDGDLDGAALALAKAGDGHYVPAHEAGKAIAT